METETIVLLGDDGEEVVAEILFTFEHDGDNYVLLTLVEEIVDTEGLDSEYPVLAYKYEELEDGKIGNLIEIADGSSDWDVVEEMFNTFSAGEFEGGDE